MNRLAVVLAADSATTVTHWGDQGKEERYFKGANKIFQVSNYHPVGLMIFDSADILKVPWEIVVKQFRSLLGQKSFNDLRGYADEFFSFLNEDTRLFPPAVQKEAYLTAARSAAVRILFRTTSEDGADEEQQRAAVDAAVVARRAEIDAMTMHVCLDSETVTSTLATWRDDLVAKLEEWRAGMERMGHLYPTKIDNLASVGMLEVFKNPGEYLGRTGIVFAGFGDHDIFPSMIEYISSGMVVGKHISEERSSGSVDHETPAWLSAFAQRSMVDTFQLGFSADLYSTFMQSLTAGLQTFAAEISGKSGGDISRVDDLQDAITKASDRIRDTVLDHARSEHSYPLRRILGVLPVDEMAELAETLINLQSLKEKVTKPSEEVGGPVDVAVITKNEGLVWIKRKHYFDINRNPRYAQRQAALYK